MNIQHKSTLDAPGTGVIATDEQHGIVEALVSVTGIRDNVNDIIVPGAYEKTLKERKPKGVWSHDWNSPVSKALDAEELMPGDNRLPTHLPNGEKWPAEAGALWVKAQFNLNTAAGKDAFENVKFFGDDGEWSIGYTVPRGKSTEEKDAKSPSGKVRMIKELNLFEFSPVLFGAASNARTFASSIKSMFANEEAREEFIKALEEDNEEAELAKDANAEGDVVENSEEKCDEPAAEEEIVSAPEGIEEVKNVREMSVKVELTPELFEQLTVLKKELDSILAQIKVASDDEEEVKVVVEPKALFEAMDDLVASTVDASVVEEIDAKVKAFDATVAKGEDASDAATSVLDLVSEALAGVTDAEEEKSLKIMAASIGLALKNAETAPVEVKAEETLTISADEWKNFMDLNF